MLLAALAGPSLRREDRTPVPNIAIVVLDDSASNRIAGRDAQLAEALAGLEDRLDRLGQTGGLEVRTVHVTDRGDEGTQLLTALAEAMAELPADRIAGAILVTDGQVHDPAALDGFPGPVQVLLTGSADDWDRRVVVETAPAFAIVDEAVSLVLRVEDLGAAPDDGAFVPLSISLDGTEPLRFDVPVNRSVTLPVTLQRGGVNVLQIATPEVAGELTNRNNAAIVSINGVRDRLRVLLVSGEPYPGERTWRNLLKSDSRRRPRPLHHPAPPGEAGLRPGLRALADRLPDPGAVHGEGRRVRPDHLRPLQAPRHPAEPLFREHRPLRARRRRAADRLGRGFRRGREPLPLAAARDPAGGRRPRGCSSRASIRWCPRSATATRSPPASRSTRRGPTAPDGTPGWGRWFRMVEVDASSGKSVMEGPEGKPLLVLDRQGEGRIAVLASDHAWLWSRGYEGGGPQLELLRRLAHWLMKEPELEEEVLRGTGEDGAVVITRRTLAESVPPVTATSPSGTASEIALTEVSPGLWEGRIEDAENGVWRLANGDQQAVAVVGPSAPKEFENPVSTADILAPLAADTRGGVRRLEDGLPDVRLVREGRVAEGRGWIGLADRNAYQLRDIRQVDLAPGWLIADPRRRPRLRRLADRGAVAP